ncbi:MAG: hypothetical protein SNJ78_06055, partial [Spirochaetales bacterium]
MVDRKVWIGAGIIGLLLLLGIGYITLKPKGGGSIQDARRNTLILAEDYSKSGEYQRALDLLDRIL